MSTTFVCRTVLLASLFAAPGVSAAETTTPESQLAVPNPFILAPDWWQYVGQKDTSERDAAIAELTEAVREAASTAPSDESVQQLLRDIQSLGRAYLTLQATPSPEPKAPEVAKDSYSFDSVLDLHSRNQEIALELKLAREQVNRKVRAIPKMEKRISTKKADYLALPPNSPERLPLALRIIEERLSVAVDEERLRLEKAQLQTWETSVGRINDELAHALERLQIDPEAVESAQRNADKYREKAEDASQKLSAIDSENYTNVQEDAAQAAALKNTRFIEAQSAVLENETIATRYELQRAFLAAQIARDDSTFDELHEARTAANLFVDEARESVALWREAAVQERARALKLLSNDHDTGTPQKDPIAEKRVRVANEISRVTAQIESSITRIVFIEQQASAFLAAQTGHLRDRWIRATDWVQATWRKVRFWAASSLFEINETPVTLVGIFRIVIILVVAVWVSKLVRHGLEHLGQRNPSVNRSSLYMLGRMFHYVILAAAFLIALSSIGLDFTKLAFVAGALGVGIGFGLQAIFSNFVSGIIVLFERSLKVGDFVELESGVTGEVREINIRSTLITTNDNIDILVPNSEFVNGRVTNWTLRDAHRRTHIPFGVAYGSDKELVKKAALEAADEVPFTLKNYPGRDPQVWLVEFGDSSLNFELVVWLTRDAVVRPGAVNSAYSWAIETALGKYDLEIPFPQRDINVRSFFGCKDESGLEWFDAATDHRSS